MNPADKNSSDKAALDPRFTFLRQQKDWTRYYFYQKSEVLYLLSYYFTEKYMHRYKDRTVDQMVQAARSGQQNIIEGKSDGVTSMETEIKLLGIARGSIQELCKDFDDYLNTRHLERWTPKHARFDALIAFCRTHNRKEDYEPLFPCYNEEELCNLGITLCTQVISMMTSHLESLQKSFVEDGGIRERMTAARLGLRTNQKETIDALQHQLDEVQKLLAATRQELNATKAQLANALAELQLLRGY